MAITTSTITGRLPLPDNTVAAGSYVEFTLTGVDVEGEVVLASPVTANLSGTATISVELWPNSLGQQRTRYRTIAYILGPSGQFRDVDFGYIVVPAADADISDLIPIRLPTNASDVLTINQGETLSVALQMVDEYKGTYDPLTSVTATSWMQRGEDAPVSLTATVTGDVIEVTKTAAAVALLPPGDYDWAIRLTDGVTVSIWTGIVRINGVPDQ